MKTIDTLPRVEEYEPLDLSKLGTQMLGRRNVFITPASGAGLHRSIHGASGGGTADPLSGGDSIYTAAA